MLNYTKAARFTRARNAGHPHPVVSSLTRLPARCYKRLFCVEVCSLMVGPHAGGTNSDAAKSAILFLLCLAVEACSERRHNP